ncbi:MAG TPA: GNVR domain-containing protein [Duganella sp.]|jgi:tyrosine-protein kinase Etk/Wzc
MNDAYDTSAQLRSLRGIAAPAPLIERVAPPPDGDPGALPWRAYLHTLLRRRWLIAAVAAFCTLAALAYALAARPVFEADMLLHVEEDSPTASKNILNDVSSLFETKKAAIAEMELLRSRLVVARAVDALRLYIHVRPRYFPLGGEWIAARSGGALSEPGLFGRGGYVWGGEKIEVTRFDVPDALYNQEFTITALDGARYRLADGSGRVVLEGGIGQPARAGGAAGPVELMVTRLAANPGARFLLRRSSRLVAIEQVQGALRIAEQGKQSGVIAVKLHGADPHQVYAILDEIGSEYMRQNLSRRTEEAQKTLTFLDRQLPVLRAQLEAAEAGYNGYRSAHATVNLEQEVRIALDALAAARARRGALIQRRAELLGRYTDAHPLLRALHQQSAETGGEIVDLEARIKRLPSIEQEQARLAREVKVSTDLYTELLNTAQQLRLVAVGRVGNVRMIDMPVAPERPIAPNRPLIVLLGMVSGIFLGALLAFASKALRGGIDEPGRIEALLGAGAVHATIAHSPGQDRARRQGSKRGRPAPTPLPLQAWAPDAAAAEGLRAFRAALQFVLPYSRNNVVACLGPAPRVGASFVSVNLALLLACGGQRTLLIDADLRDGRLHDYFGMDGAGGLAECLAGTLPPRQAVRHGVADRLDFIACGAAPPRQSELMRHDYLSSLLEALVADYDVVLMTAPPVMASADALVVGAHAGAVFLVARAGVTTEDELGAAVKRLNHAGVAPHGVLFNDA